MKTPIKEGETTWVGQGLFGLRGCFTRDETRFARLVVGVKSPKSDAFVFDIPAACLPRLPDMSEGSDFVRNGHWYHYPEESCEYSVGIGSDGMVERVVLGGEEIYTREAQVAL
jgi:hypothetical protein